VTEPRRRNCKKEREKKREEGRSTYPGKVDEGEFDVEEADGPEDVA